MDWVKWAFKIFLVLCIVTLFALHTFYHVKIQERCDKLEMIVAIQDRVLVNHNKALRVLELAIKHILKEQSEKENNKLWTGRMHEDKSTTTGGSGKWSDCWDIQKYFTGAPYKKAKDNYRMWDLSRVRDY